MPAPIVTGLLVGGAAYVLLKGAKAAPPAQETKPREVIPTPAQVTGASATTPVRTAPPTTGTLSRPATTTVTKPIITTSPTLSAVQDPVKCTTCASTNVSGMPSTQDQRYAIATAIAGGARIVI